MNPIIIANTKTYIDSISKFYSLQEKIWQLLEKNNYKYMVAVPYTFINMVAREEFIGFTVGAQNIDTTENGAHTGSVTTHNIKEAGAKFVILGHSEVRKRGESNEDISKKIIDALKNGLKVVLCVGENKRSEENFTYIKEIVEMVKIPLQLIDKKSAENLIIAYEPVWAIGANKPASPQQVQEIAILIRRTLIEILGIEAAKKIKIIYGGSVDETNAKAFLDNATVDGVLVGRACMNAEKFATLVNTLYK